MSIDKLAETIYPPGSPGGGVEPRSISPRAAANRVHEAFVVIDRADLPEIVPDTDTSTGLRATVAYDAEGHVAEAYITPAHQGYHSATPEWHEAKAKVHLAAAEYLREHPPVDAAHEEKVGKVRYALSQALGPNASHAPLDRAARLLVEAMKED